MSGVLFHGDIQTLTARLIRDRLGYLPSVVVGSPPCQDASLANRGERLGIDGTRTGLFRDALRIVQEVRPRWCCFENVVGFASVGHDWVAGEMDRLDYSLWTLNMGSEDFGSTAERRRLWLIAMANADKARLENTWRKPGSSWAGWIGAALRGLQAPRNHWLQGEGHAVGMADGLPAHVACTRVVAAYGDAVCPQITEAIGRSMSVLVPTDGTVLDLFAGAAGGWSLGLHRAGYRTVAMCEIDEWRRDVLAARYAA